MRTAVTFLLMCCLNACVPAWTGFEGVGQALVEALPMVCLEQPLYDDKTTVFTSDLSGAWQNEEGRTVLEFSSAAGNGYSVRSEYGGLGLARLAKLGGVLFMTLEAISDSEYDEKQFCPYFLMGSVALNQDTLTIVSPSTPQLQNLLDQDEIRLPWSRHGNRLTIGGTTPDLQGFFKRHANNADLFSHPIIQWLLERADR